MVSPPVTLPLCVALLALAAGGAHAEDVDDAVPAAPAVQSGLADELSPGELRRPALVPEAAPKPPAAPAVPIARYELDGQFVDSAVTILELVQAAIPVGSPFVPADSDEFGRQTSTVGRLCAALQEIGYEATGTARPTPAGMVVRLSLHPYDRVRYIFVHGNWPLREDEIQRRVRARPGSALPTSDTARAALVESERKRIAAFLVEEGYQDAEVNVRLVSKKGDPAPTDIHVDIRLGPGYPLGPITVTGNSVLPTDEIVDALRHLDWRRAWTRPAPFTMKRLREDIRTLTERYHEIGYPGARVSFETSVDRSARNVALTLTVTERKRVVIAFEGNGHKSSSTLRDRLTLFENGSYDDTELQASADALHKYYQKEGHLLARVTWKREPLALDVDRVVFVIHEGPVLKVRSIDFEGNRAFDAGALREVITLRVFPLLGAIGLGEGGYATPVQLQNDVVRLERFYRQRGYLAVKVRGDMAPARELVEHPGAQAAEAETTTQRRSELHVRFFIEEGQRVRLKEVRFETPNDVPLPLPQKLLAESMALRAGHPAALAFIEDDKRKLTRLFGDAGYPKPIIDSEVVQAPGSDEATVVWMIDPGVQRRIGPVFVRGNYTTKAETILEQIPLRSGGVQTTTGFERGQRNVGYLQLFNNGAPIRFPAGSDEQSVVPMVVEVEERNLEYKVLHLGLGVSTEQRPPDSSYPVGAQLRLGYEDRNLIGHGWNLIGQLTYGTSLLRANGTFLDRRFFGSLFRFDISANYLQQATVRLGDIRSGGGSTGFSREMFPGVDASVHYNLRNTTGTQTLLKPSGANEYTGVARIGATVGSISAAVQILRLDNRMMPSRGFRVDATAELALPSLSFGMGADTFLKLGAHGVAVVPLLDWLSLRFGVRYDQGFPLGGASVLPRVERYFAGGDTTLRGYDLDRARVEVVSMPSGNGMNMVQYRPIGGSLRVLQNVDLQFPIAPPLYGSLFIDSGIVADSFDSLPLRSFRHGVGIAPLQLKLPIGDVSFAWAWPLNPGPGDSRIGRLHVNIGLMF